MRLISFLTAAALLATDGAAMAAGDPTVSLSGYYKNLFSASKSLTGEDYSGDLNRLRLDGGYRPSKDLTFKLILDNEAVLGTVLDTPEFTVYKNTRQTCYDLGHTFVDSSGLWWRTSVYRLYAAAKSDKTSFTVGRQRIAWGSGRLWNPTDVFNPVSPFSIERDERTGTDAASLDFYPGALSDVTAVYAPGRGEDNDVALRAKTNVKGYDVSLVLASLNNRDLAGVDFAGNLGDASLRGEATYEDRKRANPLFPAMPEQYTRAVLSTDYTFPDTLYVLLEYLYNGGSVKQSVPLTFVQTEIVTKNRNFAALGLGYDLTPLIRPEGILVYDIDGWGTFFNPSVKYNVRENIDWVLGAQLFGGQGEFAGVSNVYYTSIKLYF